jgi:hypothetical protein
MTDPTRTLTDTPLQVARIGTAEIATRLLRRYRAVPQIHAGSERASRALCTAGSYRFGSND